MLQTIEDTAPSKKGNGLHYAFIICLGGFLRGFGSLCDKGLA